MPAPPPLPMHPWMRLHSGVARPCTGGPGARGPRGSSGLRHQLRRTQRVSGDPPQVEGLFWRRRAAAQEAGLRGGRSGALGLTARPGGGGGLSAGAGQSVLRQTPPSLHWTPPPKRVIRQRPHSSLSAPLGRRGSWGAQSIPPCPPYAPPPPSPSVRGGAMCRLTRWV